MPLITVIVPTRPGQSEIKAVEGCRQLDYPKVQIEILVARGQQPAVQRNAALKAARGDLIYFLDDDSVPLAGNLRRAIPQFNDPAVKMVGGHTRLIQCLVGWPSHDARNYLSDPRNQGIDLYGFAEPRDNSLPLSPQIYLHQPAASFQGDERRMVNDRNIAALARYYRGLPMDR